MAADGTQSGNDARSVRGRQRAGGGARRGQSRHGAGVRADRVRDRARLRAAQATSTGLCSPAWDTGCFISPGKTIEGAIGAREARRVARLRVGVRDAHRRLGVADGADRVRGRHQRDQGGHGRGADLHAHAGHDGADGCHDRRDLRRTPDARPRRLPPPRGGGLARPDDRPPGGGDARIPGDRARDPAR